jgi:dTDP-4-dehydrorhamnose 3,5-epimerase-like enzyme
MSDHEPGAPRLVVAYEAEALIANFGSEAYAMACRRAEEASSETLAADWREVALTISRKDKNASRSGPAIGSDPWPF